MTNTLKIKHAYRLDIFEDDFNYNGKTNVVTVEDLKTKLLQLKLEMAEEDILDHNQRKFIFSKIDELLLELR